MGVYTLQALQAKFLVRKMENIRVFRGGGNAAKGRLFHLVQKINKDGERQKQNHKNCYHDI